MIPRKLYIPTSTLNFNNIMSSESISPASFYGIRGYGYRSIEKVCANNLDNRVLLYEYCPIYHIEDLERDNYPLVIEIDTTQLRDGVILKDAGSYYSEQTIYFSALTTVFLFPDKISLTTVLNKSKQSIETKLVDLYEHNFTTIQAYEVQKEEWRKSNQIEDVNANKDKYVEVDRRIDRLKGFLYAHVLGVEKSSSVEIVKLRNLSRQLYNTWSAVISSAFNTPSAKQKNELEELYGKINNLIAKIVDRDKQIASVFQNELHIDESVSMGVVNILKKYGRYDIGDFFGLESFKYQPLSLYGIDLEEKMSSLSKHIAELDNFISIRSQTLIKHTTDDLPEISDLQIVQYKGKSKEQSEFLINMFNTFLNGSSKELLIQDRYGFARMGGELFKNKIIDKWEGSPEKVYINGLLKNIKMHTLFEVSNSSNITLKSFATFCQVANSDIEKLESNLIKNEITDYKIAFGLWGITFGFAGISKMTYNEIYNRCGEDFFYKLYKHIYAELHEVKLQGNIPKHILIERNFNLKHKDNIIDNQLSKDKLLNELKKAKIVKKRYAGLEVDQIYNNIIDKYTKHNCNWEQAFQDMTDDKTAGITLTIVNNICNLFGMPKYKQKSKMPKTHSSQKKVIGKSLSDIGLSSNLTHRQLDNISFWDDDKLWSYIQDEFDEKNRKQAHEDIIWFQKEYQKGDKSDYYSKARRDKDSVCIAFEKFLEKKKYVNEQVLMNVMRKIKLKYK